MADPTGISPGQALLRGDATLDDLVVDAVSRTRQDQAEELTRTVQLLADAADGDEQAWEAIVDRYSGLLWGVVRAYRLADAEGADVIQATWLHLLQHIDQIRDPEAMVTWLITTARRETLRVLRRTRETSTEPQELENTVPPPSGFTSELLGAESIDEAMRTLDRLPSRCRALLLLIDQGVSYGEISQILNMPIGSIGPTRARCLRLLRHELGGGRR
jgi:RNA polymerase sigma factor (sigma-70 family)